MTILHTKRRPEPAHMTPSDFTLLRKCKSSREWDKATVEIRKRHKGALPFNWSVDVVGSGLMDEMHAEWTDDDA